MGRRKPRNRDAIGRAAHIVQAELMAELNGTGIAAVLTADAELDPRTGFPTAHDGLLHQGPYTFSIEHRKGICFHNVGGSIKIDELRGIIA
jgi:hypothetical protein